MFVYVLYSKKFDRLYIGMSKNVELRLDEHNAGKTKSTKGYRPWEVIYKEECEDRTSARAKEKYFKSGIGREFIRTNFLAL